MPKPRSKKPPLHLDVTCLPPLPPTLEGWQRAFIEPVLVCLLNAPKPCPTNATEVRDGEAC